MYGQATYGGCEIIIPGLHRGVPPSGDSLRQYFDTVVYCTNPEFDYFLPKVDSQTQPRQYSFHLDEIDKSPDVLTHKVRDVADTVLRGGNVAALCSSGINRSGVFCVLVMLKLGYTVDDAMNILASSGRGTPRGDVRALVSPILKHLAP